VGCSDTANGNIVSTSTDYQTDGEEVKPSGNIFQESFTKLLQTQYKYAIVNP